MASFQTFWKYDFLIHLWHPPDLVRLRILIWVESNGIHGLLNFLFLTTGKNFAYYSHELVWQVRQDASWGQTHALSLVRYILETSHAIAITITVHRSMSLTWKCSQEACQISISQEVFRNLPHWMPAVSSGASVLYRIYLALGVRAALPLYLTILSNAPLSSVDPPFIQLWGTLPTRLHNITDSQKVRPQSALRNSHTLKVNTRFNRG